MKKQHGWTLEKMAEEGYGKKDVVNELLRILELPKEIISKISERSEIFGQHAKYIWQLNPKSDLTIYEDKGKTKVVKSVRIFKLWKTITGLCPESCVRWSGRGLFYLG